MTAEALSTESLANVPARLLNSGDSKSFGISVEWLVTNDQQTVHKLSGAVQSLEDHKNDPPVLHPPGHSANTGNGGPAASSAFPYFSGLRIYSSWHGAWLNFSDNPQDAAHDHDSQQTVRRQSSTVALFQSRFNLVCPKTFRGAIRQSEIFQRVPFQPGVIQKQIVQDLFDIIGLRARLSEPKSESSHT